MTDLITESEYNQSIYPVLFKAEDKSNRVYATISKNNIGYRFAWQSDEIKPCVVEIKENVYAIGVDTYFAIVDLYAEKINLEVRLDYFLLDIKIIDNFLYIISELEIIKINQCQYEILKKYDLPDIFESIEMVNNNICIQCFDKQSIVLDGYSG